jgi:hypothetical protein
MDIWESNSRALGFTPHPCSIESIYGCEGEECTFDGVCDQWGCGFNPYALGQPKYFGRGSEYVIDTTKKFTVTTQFITDDNTASGSLIDVRRSYRQGNKTIENAVATAASGHEGLNSITDVSSFSMATGLFFPFYHKLTMPRNTATPRAPKACASEVWTPKAALSSAVQSSSSPSGTATATS